MQPIPHAKELSCATFKRLLEWMFLGVTETIVG